jgi:hypothetical protein
MLLDKNDTHYVILVHGTWSDSPGWHKFDNEGPGNFCSALDSKLAERGLSGAVERRIDGATTSFTWSGANKHDDRVAAGLALGKQIAQITESDPNARVHIVAHSHGCNVTLKAVEWYLAHLDSRALSVAMRAAPNDLAGLRGERARRSAVRLDDNIDFIEMRRRRRDQTEFVPLAHKVHAARRAWRMSPQRNRLGRVVFLGPPFLRKYWSQRSKLIRMALSLGDFMAGFLLGAISIYFLSIVVWTILWIPFFLIYLITDYEVLRTTSFNPLEWNTWLFGVVIIIGALVSIISEVIARETSQRTNKNFYFDPDRSDDRFPNFDLDMPLEKSKIEEDEQAMVSPDKGGRDLGNL